MNTMLIFPPRFDVTMPHLALPCLAAVLRKAGHRVLVRDINAESYDHLLTEDELRRAFQRILERRKYFIFHGTPPLEEERLLNKREFLFQNVQKAKELLKSKESFFDFKKYHDSIEILNDALKFLSLAYYRTELTLDFFKTNYSHESTSQILEAVEDEISNPYVDYYERYTLPGIIAEAPRLIGISISSSNQLIPGLTLAHLIKKALPEVHLVAGGNHITVIQEALEGNIPIFSLVDSFIVHEGETALLKLVECIETGSSLDAVPNLIYKDEEGRVRVNTQKYKEDVNDLPTPDFEGLPLHLYLSSELLLPIYSSRGCYWGKCSFCNFHKTSGIQFRARSEDRVVEDIRRLSLAHGSRNFIFVDEALSPQYLRRLSEALLDQKLEVQWLSFARFEKQIDRDLCELLAKSGCTYLAFGLESACGRVLQKMQKGTDTMRIADILKNTHEAGIANHVSIIFGFPTETPEEAWETAQFVLSHLDRISSIVSSQFTLAKGSHVFLHPEDYGVRVLDPQKEHDLAYTYAYDVQSGLSQKQAVTMNRSFVEAMLKEKYPFYAYGVFLNYHVFLYVRKYKTNNLFDLYLEGLGLEKEKVLSEMIGRSERIIRSV